MSFSDRPPVNGPLRFSPASPEYLELTEAPAPPAWRGGVFRSRKSAAKPLTEEQRLLRSLKRGDRATFAKVIDRYQRTIFGYLRARVSDLNDAEDMTQEVFLRLYQGRARLAGDVNLRAWLIGIARNVLREHVRDLKRRKEVAWTELCLEVEAMSPVDDQDDDTALKRLPGCMAALGQSARSALELHYQSQLRLTEIAARFKRSEGAVKQLMFRARLALRRCLDNKSDDTKPEKE